MYTYTSNDLGFLNIYIFFVQFKFLAGIYCGESVYLAKSQIFATTGTDPCVISCESEKLEK